MGPAPRAVRRPPQHSFGAMVEDPNSGAVGGGADPGEAPRGIPSAHFRASCKADAGSSRRRQRDRDSSDFMTLVVSDLPHDLDNKVILYKVKIHKIRAPKYGRCLERSQRPPLFLTPTNAMCWTRSRSGPAHRQRQRQPLGARTPVRTEASQPDLPLHPKGPATSSPRPSIPIDLPRP